MTDDMTRRGALIGLSGGFAALCAAPGQALTTSGAEQLIDSLVSDVNAVINSGRPEREMYAEFEQIIRRYADMDIVARSVLGADARAASSAQMRAFTDAFADYAAQKYGQRFRQFIGGRLEVTDARKVRDFREVTATAYLRGDDPFEVVFLVSDKSGEEKFFNMYVEGVNMVASERAEIGAMLDRRGGNLNALIEDLPNTG